MYVGLKEKKRTRAGNVTSHAQSDVCGILLAVHFFLCTHSWMLYHYPVTSLNVNKRHLLHVRGDRLTMLEGDGGVMNLS